MNDAREFADDLLDAVPEYSSFYDMVSARDAEWRRLVEEAQAGWDRSKGELAEARGIVNSHVFHDDEWPAERCRSHRFLARATCTASAGKCNSPKACGEAGKCIDARMRETLGESPTPHRSDVCADDRYGWNSNMHPINLKHGVCSFVEQPAELTGVVTDEQIQRALERGANDRAAATGQSRPFPAAHTCGCYVCGKKMPPVPSHTGAKPMEKL